MSRGPNEPSMIIARKEMPGDIVGIRAVHRAGFGRQGEADLVEALRAAGAALLSLVVEQDGSIVGHLLFSRVCIRPDASGDEIPGAALAPVAVLPERQRRGIGSALIHEGLARLAAAGEKMVFVVGEPGYDARFGFVPARPLGFRCKWPGTDEAFMMRSVAGSPRVPATTCMVLFHAAFDDV